MKGKQKLDITSALKENKHQIQKLKNDKDMHAYQIATTTKNNPTLLRLYNELKNTKAVMEQHICHSCDLKETHYTMFNKLNALEYSSIFSLY